jgi:hypothetical protein
MGYKNELLTEGLKKCRGENKTPKCLIYAQPLDERLGSLRFR